VLQAVVELAISLLNRCRCADGNGRTGRILNVLMLVDAGLLRLPVLYLSRYIIDTKSDYYRLLLAVTAESAWEEWVLTS
jgi:Fic family protein